MKRGKVWQGVLISSAAQQSCFTCDSWKIPVIESCKPRFDVDDELEMCMTVRSELVCGLRKQ